MQKKIKLESVVIKENDAVIRIRVSTIALVLKCLKRSQDNEK